MAGETGGSAAFNRRKFLELSAGALVVSAGGGIAGCGDGGASASGVALSETRRSDVFNAVAQMTNSLTHADLNADSQAIQRFLNARPEVNATIITSDGNIWAQFTDGLLFGVINNVIPDTSPPASKALSRDLELPSAAGAPLFYAFGQGLTSAVNTIGGWLKNNGYGAIISDSVDVEVLKTVGASTGVFYIDAHGGLFYSSVTAGSGKAAPTAAHSARSRDIFRTDGPVSFALSTTTPVTIANQATYAQDWKSGRLIPVIAPGKTAKTGGVGIVYGQIWCITEKFVTQYMSFSPNSLLFINACTSYNDPFRLACVSKGASVYVGWSRSIGDTVSYNIALDSFDQMLGINQVVKLTPNERPFDWPSVYSYLVSKGLDKPDPIRPEAQLLTFTNSAAGTTSFGILTPSISNISVSGGPPASRLTILGNFGADPGANGSVIIYPTGAPASSTPGAGGASLAIQAWTPTQITCALPTTGGDVVVTAFQHPSNPRRLTEWKGALNYQGSGPSDHSESFAMDIHILADIESFRTQPGQPLTGANALLQAAAFNTLPDATCSYTNTGSWNTSQANISWFGGSALSPGGFGADPGFHYEGSVDPVAKVLKLLFTLQVPQAVTVQDKDANGNIVSTATGSLSVTPAQNFPTHADNSVVGHLPFALGSNLEILAGSISDSVTFQYDNGPGTINTSLSWSMIPVTSGTQPDPNAARSVHH